MKIQSTLTALCLALMLVILPACHRRCDPCVKPPVCKPLCKPVCPKPCPKPCKPRCPKPCKPRCPKPCKPRCPKPCKPRCPRPCDVGYNNGYNGDMVVRHHDMNGDMANTDISIDMNNDDMVDGNYADTTVDMTVTKQRP